jgi:hypothetical protein
MAGRSAAPPMLAELGEIDLGPRYVLTAERQTRSGELHYFDHPAFGVLVMITPVPETPAPNASPPGAPAA